MIVRSYAPRLAARLLLRRAWSQARSSDVWDFLRNSLVVAANCLQLDVKRVPGISGEIAGVLDRKTRKVLIATKFSPASQRFTIAHELGHYLLHPGRTYFRDRELSLNGESREYYEIEADAFAAEFLIPRDHLAALFREIFGTIRLSDLADALSACFGQEHSSAEALAAASPLARAMAVAKLYCYKGRFFRPFTEQFNVSATAMGIQLLRAGLIE